MKNTRPAEWNKVKVYCDRCKEWIPEEEVESRDISEDILGKDLMKFRCPYCETEQESHRVR